MVYGGTAIRFCPAHARDPLTVLCFSLQKSLAPLRPYQVLLFPFRKLVQVDPWNGIRPWAGPCSPSHRSRAAVLHACYLGDSAFNNFSFKIPYPPILLAPLYGCKFAGQGFRNTPSLAPPSSSSLAPFLTMAEVPLFQYGWTTSRVPQLGPHGSVVDKLSVFSTSRYAGLLCPRFVSV